MSVLLQVKIQQRYMLSQSSVIIPNHLCLLQKTYEWEVGAPQSDITGMSAKSLKEAASVVMPLHQYTIVS